MHTSTSVDDAMDRIYADLKQFNHFSSPEANIASVQRSGNTAHFAVNGAAPALASWVIGNSIDVTLWDRDAQKQVVAVTIGDHPLVGVRKWWPEKAGELLSSSGGIVDIITEAYERKSGLFNRFGYWLAGPYGQNDMWLTYLQNIATYWKGNYNASVVEWEAKHNRVSGTQNPFRAELPAALQNSRFTHR